MLTVRVVQPHTMSSGVKLLETEVLYIIDQPEGEWWFGMTHDGLTGHFRKVCVGEVKSVNPDGTRYIYIHCMHVEEIKHCHV